MFTQLSEYKLSEYSHPRHDHANGRRTTKNAAMVVPATIEPLVPRPNGLKASFRGVSKTDVRTATTTSDQLTNDQT